MTEPQNLPPRRPKTDAEQAAQQPVQPVQTDGGYPTEAASRKKGGLGKWLLLLLLLGLAGGGAFFKMQQDEKAEEAAAARLKEMGLILSNRNGHVSTISLVTLNEDQELFDEAVDLLPALKGLESVDLRRSLVADKHMPTIGKIKSAATLNLTDTSVTDAGLAHIRSMTNLQTLFLSGTKATNAIIPTIAKLKKLRIIEMSGGDVTGGLGPLATLPQLNWLVLRGIHITDSSLAELGKSKTISHLTLSDTEIDDLESLETFKQLTDNVKID